MRSIGFVHGACVSRGDRASSIGRCAGRRAGRRSSPQAWCGSAAVAACVLGPAGQALAQQDLLVADRAARAVFRFDAQSGAFLDVFIGPDAAAGMDPVDVQVGPDGHVYVANFNPGTIHRFDGQSGAFLGTFFDYDNMEEAVALLFSEDGREGYILGNDTQNLVVFDAASGRVLRDIRTPPMRFAHDMAFDDQGFLHVVTENRTVGLVQVWSLDPDQVVRTYAPPPQGLLIAVAIQPADAAGNPGDAFISDFTNDAILRFDGQSGEFIEQVVQDDRLDWTTSLHFLSSSRLLASTRQGLHVIDVDARQIVETLIPTGTYGGLNLSDPRGLVIRGQPCVVDLDGDGALTAFDFLAFQNLFDAGDPLADLDGDGLLTLLDFLAFQNLFDAGCE
ncbi:MAG: hypothetical protein KatS3mg103_1108 [Phycisphaerales bacterium]|nr:MAG: hypothetical protein KatS3mg103_1108 [Phycisphaerales bacterium]